jgi:hypothetical protein
METELKRMMDELEGKVRRLEIGVSRFVRGQEMTILVDLDGVLVAPPTPEIERGIRIAVGASSDTHWSDLPNVFLYLKPMDGAIESYRLLATKYDMHIVSTAPWGNDSAWTDKLKWVKRHIPEAAKRLTLTHRKGDLIGDCIIDDRKKNGVESFMGRHIHFGHEPFFGWKEVLEELMPSRR